VNDPIDAINRQLDALETSRPSYMPTSHSTNDMNNLRFRTWPITEAQALETKLQKMGLRVPASEIDGTSAANAGRSLSDALVSVGPAGRGGTGSFLSADGLILTNHHVALDAVRQASTTEHDYLADGFVARSREEELRGPDYEVRITQQCQDVSARMLQALHAESDPLKRANRLRDERHAIATEREAELKAKDPAASGALRCEVQEMFAEKSYVLFTYYLLRDVRIVYVPPMCLGNFGGDMDNFEWPRHSADFTLLRAYVAPDGSSAEPHPSNVPFHPTKFLRACAAGAAPDDFVFLLGFPGHTMRYAPAARLSYADEVAVPKLVDDFARKLRLIQEHGTDRAVMLKLLSAKKSLANEHKRSVGKRIMMQKLGLLKERQAEEACLIAAAPEVAPLLARVQEIYDSFRASSERDSALEALRGVYAGSALFYIGHTLHEADLEAHKDDGDREDAYRHRNHPYLIKRIVKRLTDMHSPHEAALVAQAVATASAAGFSEIAELIPEAAAAVEGSSLASLTAESVEAVLAGKGMLDPADVFLQAAAVLYKDYTASRDTQKALFSERDKLLAKLLELQKANSTEEFYPDANGTLRLSAGFVEGYTATDACTHLPVTTISGLVDKHLEAKLSGGDGDSEFDCPVRLVALCEEDPSTTKIPVNICYSTDTLGGNSGSPVLNARGEFIGINFDRQRQGLMNEYKWSHLFSRSIGVDVRYILWMVGTYDAAMHLVAEMVDSPSAAL